MRKAVYQLLVYFRSCYQLDVRALAFLRIGVAALVITDLCIRCCDLEAHYTDWGVISVHLLKIRGWQNGFWSFHTLSGGLTWQVILFALHFAVAIALLVGFRTRYITPLLWVFTLSLHNRNTFIAQSGDDLLRLVIFWGIFLPWGNCYSISKNATNQRQQHFSLAGLGFLILIASVYFFTVNLKTSPEWRSEGTAIYYALSLDQIRWLLGDWLYQYPSLMKALTHTVYYIEVIIPFFILLPIRKQWPRIVAFLLLIGLHIGIGLTLYIGLFYLINIITAIGFLPASVFNRLKIPYSFAWRQQNRAPKRWQQQVRLVIVVSVISLNLISNLSYCGWFSFTLRKEIWKGIYMLRLDQYWGMFSPSVLKDDGWLVYRGFDKNGQMFDLYKQTDTVDFKKPTSVVDMYSSDRWRKFAENYQSGFRGYLHQPYCRWYLNHWNKQHPERPMQRLEVYFIDEVSLANYQTQALRQRLCATCNDE